jgi:tetratricopeptide (TPR) repeat protein
MLEKIIEMCDRRLDQNSNDLTALFFKGGSIGFRGRLRANRASWLSAAQDGVAALPIVRKAHELDSNNADVLLGIGIYNYYAEVVPEEYPLLKPFMWFFPSGDRQKGLEQLQFAAENGKYAHIEASYFLMQNYFFYEKEYFKALELAQKLSGMFPRNPVFLRYLGRCQVRVGNWSEVYRVFSEIAKYCRERQPGFGIADAREAAYYLGRFLFIGKTLDESLEQFNRCEELSRALDKEEGSGFATMANLHIGMIYDLQKKRSLAIMQYQKVLGMKEYEESHNDARRYLKEPYHR